MVADRVQVKKGTILQFLFNAPDTQTVGNGGVDFHGFQSDQPLLFRAFKLKGPDIVQPVRQLNDDDPDVLAHGQQHFPDILRLLIFFGSKGQLFNFSDAVHHQGHIVAELFLKDFQGNIGVLHHIVEQGRADAVAVHAKANQDFRHRQRMGNIWLS